MATVKKKGRKMNPVRRKNEGDRLLWGIFFLIMAVLTFVSIFDFDPMQSARITTDVVNHNMVGIVGAEIAFWTLRYLGMACWLVSLYLLWQSYMFLFSHWDKLSAGKYICIVVCIVAACIALNLIETEFFGSRADNVFSNDYYTNGIGGAVGTILYKKFLSENFGSFGTIVVLIGTFVIGALIIFHDNLGSASHTIYDKFKAWLTRRNDVRKEKKKASQPPPVIKQGKKPKVLSNPLRIGKTSPKDEDDESTFKSETLMDDPEPAVEGGMLDTSKMKIGTSKSSNKFQLGKKTRSKVEDALKIIATEETKKASVPLPEKSGNYHFPPLSMLNEIEITSNVSDNENHQETAETLVRTLGEFGVKVTMGEVHTGPVITRYDIHPAPGVRVEKIMNLDKNIALGLKAISVRILAPVPGKGCVGVEVPNKTSLSVKVRDIIESENWGNCKSEIPIVLGKDVSGKPLIADLARMPHLLIAGSTGAGKTVCINTIITSLLFHSSPENLRFVMVDPKIVEMQVFNDLPHMLIPVVTDPKKVPAALKYLINEMEKRYKIFAKIGVRNIVGFNAKQSKNKEEAAQAEKLEAELSAEERAAVSTIEVRRDEEIEIPEKLPYIVCIVDELADLMMVAPADVETCIARLAQLARAAGIHLIIATQRPSVNVITGVIKANLPSRIAFKVASKIDSRTILDANGADHLIGRGDMLFLPPGTSDLVRAQGAFVDDDEITDIVKFLKQNGPPDFDSKFQRSIEEESDGDGADSGGPEEFEDELVPDAIEVLRASKRASTSMLQRRLRIGYNRAARIMELLEDKGIVGPENGAQPREILKDLDSLSL